MELYGVWRSVVSTVGVSIYQYLEYVYPHGYVLRRKIFGHNLLNRPMALMDEFRLDRDVEVEVKVKDKDELEVAVAPAVEAVTIPMPPGNCSCCFPAKFIASEMSKPPCSRLASKSNSALDKV